jgi:hypothetical protein
MAIDPVQLLIQAGAIPANPFAPNSRYHTVKIDRFVRALGDPGVAYVLRRFVPQMRDIAVVAEHIVASGERPDLLAVQMLGDAELYWRIADSNAVTDPFELTDTVGTRVGIPRPPGL